MKERPILFSAPMVRAILDGRKTQTRRVVKHPGLQSLSFIVDCGDGWWGDEEGDFQALCPYGKRGDRLWVREAHQIDLDGEGQHHLTLYRADYSQNDLAPGWRPSIHMPRWASRITLEITAVRAERLQDISEADALSEGVQPLPLQNALRGAWFTGDAANGISLHDRSPQLAYRKLWNSINGPGSWDKNPYVWVIDFKRI